MRPIISRTIGKANLGVLRAVERFFEGEQLLLHRTFEALFFAFFGLCAIYIAHDFTGRYFSSITVATAILVTLFSGLFNQSISSCTFLLTGRISSDSEGR